MTVSLSHQLWCLGWAAGLGAAAGVLYDGMRLVRARLPFPLLAAALDLLFWLGVTLVLFLFAIVSGNGLVRLYTIIAMAGGGGAYFLLFSRFFLAGGAFFLRWAGKVLRFLLLPLVLPLRFLKKIRKKAKNHFLSHKKWFRIKMVSNCGSAEKGGQRCENEKSRHSHKGHRHSASGLFCRRPHRPAHADQDRRN